MSFYKTISRYYDQIFPVREDQLAFIRNNKKRLKVLDVACGNGGYLNRLSEFGFYGFGIDLDHDMIHIANSKKTSDKVDFYQMDMLEIETFKCRSFDLIYSIGNSIVHLNDTNQIEEFILKAYQLLKPKGEMILQIINYDRILDQNIKNLPTIQNDDIMMERHYTYENGKILFNTKLIVDGFTHENTVALFPIRSETLSNLIEKAGFRKYETYGDFKKTMFSKESSMHLIIKAYK